MRHRAARDDAQELTGVVTADPHAALGVDAQAIRVAAGAEIGEHRGRAETPVRSG